MALKTAPVIGAIINIHTWLNAMPPAKTAGPMLRAGFTETPVT